MTFVPETLLHHGLHFSRYKRGRVALIRCNRCYVGFVGARVASKMRRHARTHAPSATPFPGKANHCGVIATSVMSFEDGNQPAPGKPDSQCRRVPAPRGNPGAQGD